MARQTLSILIIGILLLGFFGCSKEQKKQPEKKAVQIQEKASADLPKETVGKDGAHMVLIPAGEFHMGSNAHDSEKPVHTVCIDAFCMDKYEVTNALYKKFVDANPQWGKDGIESRYYDGDYLKYWNGDSYPSGEADHPVVYVSWHAANAYAEWAGKRLPTEAEWEKAARGGLTGKEYPWGDKLTHDNANYYGTGGRDKWEYTSPVGSFAPNGYGVYDMAGNVYEWCADWYDSEYYPNSPRNNPTGPNTGSRRVVRGGSWLNYYDSDLRCADRPYILPTGTSVNMGFRCVVVAQDLVIP